MAWTLVRKCGMNPNGHRLRQKLLAFAMALHPRLGNASRASVLDDCLLKMMVTPHLAPGPLDLEIKERHKRSSTVKLLNWKKIKYIDGLCWQILAELADFG
jgi:hypothetical protein